MGAVDGPAAWTISEPARDWVMEKIGSAVSRWKVDSSRSINYRSLLPILRLLSCHECPQAQMVAAWAIANLILLHSFKYIRLTKDEGGEEILKSIQYDKFTPESRIRMKELGIIILQNTSSPC